MIPIAYTRTFLLLHRSRIVAWSNNPDHQCDHDYGDQWVAIHTGRVQPDVEEEA